MMRIWRLIFLVYVVLFATACYQSIRTVGTIEIDADKPVVHDGLLPVGLTLGGKSISGKDLLSHNLLINGGFELAPRLENCKYDFNTQEITTPNGYTTVYPVPEIHFGWKILHGLSAVQRAEGGASSLYHISLIPARDSLNSVEIINTARFSVLSRDAYTFSARMKASSDSLSISIVLVDSALVELSEAQKVHLSSQTWERVMATVSPNKSSDVAHMMIRVKGRGSVSIDDITFTPSDMKLTHNLSDSLFYLIRDFGAGFIRFPEGRVANGFFPGTYPRWARETDTSSKFPFWTISGHEYTGDFGLDDFLLLSKLLRLPPILVSNIGMTDRTAAPRAENIKFLGDRISAHLELGIS
ncbi:MAG: hypothetical protein Q4A53_00070 [Porphyromonas sp.]|nr:hypothetical protein [Porphyromonas sp.]